MRGRAAKRNYHHGNLAESLLDSVDEIATRFGLEAVTLRACAKLVGVSPSSAFRHYADKRALMTAFAARAIEKLSASLETAKADADDEGAFEAVGVAYVAFAIDRPAFFRAMWGGETLYTADAAYVAAVARLSGHLQAGFAATIADDDPEALSPQELLSWSAVHGLAGLFVDGPLGGSRDREEKLDTARGMLAVLAPSLAGST